MTFSIIVAAYNRKDVLIKAIQKIMATDFPKSEYEIIIGDNNSSDGTRERVEEFAKNNEGKVNLKYLVEKRKGNVYARHSAVKHAVGKYLVFCDDDCYVAENWLSELDQILKKYPDIGLLGTRIEIIWDATPPKWIKTYQPFLGEISAPEPFVMADKGLFVNSGSMTIPRELFLSIEGTLPEQIGGYYVGDGETGLCHKLHKLQKPIALTNNTYVDHFQIVSRNATLADMKRRFENKGICEAYNDVYREGSRDTSQVVKLRNESLFKCLKNLLLLRRFLARDYYFHYFYYKRKAEYITFFNINRKNDSNDWLLNQKYMAPELIYSTTFANKIKS